MNLYEAPNILHKIAEFIRTENTKISYNELNMYMEALSYAESYLSQIRDHQKVEIPSKYILVGEYIKTPDMELT